jgi:hypothetical protein
MKKLLILIILSIGCSNEVDPITKLENDLLGNWEWLKTSGKGFSESPSTVGYTKKLNFLENKMVEIYINDTLQSTIEYLVYYTKSSTTHLAVHVDEYTYGPVGFRGDSLIFDSSYYDGPIIIYKKLD